MFKWFNYQTALLYIVNIYIRLYAERDSSLEFK